LSAAAAFSANFLPTALLADDSVKPKIRTLPTQTPLTNCVVNDQGLLEFSIEGKGKVMNVFTTAVEAMQGEASAKNCLASSGNRGLLPKLPDSSAKISDPYRAAALNWLETNGLPINDRATIWTYNFDNVYNDVFIASPWSSAFGQAHVLQAFVKAYNDTKDPKYLKLARKAAWAFDVPIEQGGFKSTLEGDIFFEEVPRPPAPHILNGHMIGTIALIEAGRSLADPEIEALGMKGVLTLKHHLWLYDTGYWSRYDLNPRKFEIPIRLVPLDSRSAAGFQLDAVSVLDPSSGKAVRLDVGASDDSEGAWRIGGSDWQQGSIKDGRSVRTMAFGVDKNKAPLKGGTIQNSYVYVELPTQDFFSFTGSESWLIKFDFFDAAPSRILVQSQVIDQGNFAKFRTLPGGVIETTGTGQWRTVFVNLESKDLAWYVGPEYQKYHVQLLKNLGELTGDPIFKAYEQRWQTYIDAHNDRNAEDFWHPVPEPAPAPPQPKQFLCRIELFGHCFWRSKL
jgi:hypothetical protein